MKLLSSYEDAGRSQHDDISLFHAMLKHFTATALILHKQKILLLFHKKLKSWLPPGGHIEENELPHECAIRETKEETGIDIEIVSFQRGVGDAFATELPLPYCCLEETIPEWENHLEHRHIDMIFLAHPKNFSISGNDEIRWFSLEEIQKLSEKEIFGNCKRLCIEALQRKKNLYDL